MVVVLFMDHKGAKGILQGEFGKVWETEKVKGSTSTTGEACSRQRIEVASSLVRCSHIPAQQLVHDTIQPLPPKTKYGVVQ